MELVHRLAGRTLRFIIEYTKYFYQTKL